MAAVSIAGREIEVRQLTMAEIRDVMREIRDMAGNSDNEPHIMDMLYDDPVPAVAVAAATGLSLAELAGSFSQEHGRQLLDEVRAANPFFVGMMERLVAAGRQIDSSN